MWLMFLSPLVCQQNSADGSWEDPALEKLHLFCEESRGLNDWVPEITIPKRWSSLLRCCKPSSYKEILILLQDDTVSHPWILLRRIPIQAARGRPEWPPVISSSLVPSMPSWLPFFMWMRSGMPQERQNGPHSLCGWGLERKEERVLHPVFHRANVARWSTRSRRRSGAKKKHS